MKIKYVNKSQQLIMERCVFKEMWSDVLPLTLQASEYTAFIILYTTACKQQDQVQM